jgi:16S rRNA (cytosine967-C5)-methyltransferase
MEVALPSARDLAADVLLAAETRGRWTRDLLPAARERVVDARDRGLLTELVQGALRHRLTLDVVTGAFSRRALADLHAAARSALRVATYPILFLDRIPAHASVDHAVGWTRSRAGAGAAGYVNAVLRAMLRGIEGRVVSARDPRRDVPREDGSGVRLRTDVFADPAAEPTRNLAERYACPPWIVERWLARRGAARTEAILRAGIVRPPLVLRSRVPRPELLAELRAREVDAHEGDGDTAVVVPSGEGLALAPVREGRAAVQDTTAQRVAPLLQPRPGRRWLDLCAAPGGKTLHLADLAGTGTIVACDVDPRRIAVLEGLRERMPPGVRLEVVPVPADGPLPFEDGSFDGILIDAPCSNTGVLRRRVEARWRLVPEDIASLAHLQRGLIERALPLLAPDGRLVYSTCSIEPEEDGDLVSAVLAAHPALVDDTAFDVPPTREADGGFAAVLRHASA